MCKKQIIILLLLCAFITDASAQRNRDRRRWEATENGLVYKVLQCLQHRDTAAYFDLFPPFDTLWSMVNRNTDNTPEAQQELNNLKQHPQILVEFDPLYNRSIIDGFAHVLGKGDDSGVQWSSVVMARYELHMQEPKQSMMGYGRIVPERFAGYLFVQDEFNRVTYCIRIAEIQKIKGQFFGGQLLNVLQAKNVDEFVRKEEIEQDYLQWLAANPDTTTAIATKDSTDVADTTAGDNPLLMRRDEGPEEDAERREEVVDRRYYEGMMDNEIPIKMYIRYMRVLPGKPQQYDGLYKLGDSKKYLKLEITITPEGKWVIEDESAVGVMELVLKGRNYVGGWSNADENGFDVVMSQTGTPKGKIEILDKILDRGANPRVDESMFDEDEDGGKGKKRRKNSKEEEGKDKKQEKPAEKEPAKESEKPAEKANNDDGDSGKKKRKKTKDKENKEADGTQQK